MSAIVAAAASTTRPPHVNALARAWELSIETGKPVLSDMWAASLNGEICVAVTETKERFVMKSSSEYTSCVERLVKPDGQNDVVAVTMNSIYILAAGVKQRMIKSSDLIRDPEEDEFDDDDDEN